MIPRLPHSRATKEKLRRAALGRTVPPEVRARISAKMTGRKHTPEAIAKITAARRARKGLTNEELIAECKKRNEARKLARNLRAKKQWRLDVLGAYKLGDKALLEDVLASKGRWNKRRLHHDAISDGYSTHYNQQMYIPFLLKLRKPGQCPPKIQTNW